MENPNPIILSNEEILERQRRRFDTDLDPSFFKSDLLTDKPREEITSDEIFDMIRNLSDPEYPMTLEELFVVAPNLIQVDNKEKVIDVRFTPTIAHCTQAALIGLMIRARLYLCVPRCYKINVYITEKSHEDEKALNKQLNDKERVIAALENPIIKNTVKQGSKAEQAHFKTLWAAV